MFHVLKVITDKPNAAMPYQGITFKGRDRDAPLKIKKES